MLELVANLDRNHVTQRLGGFGSFSQLPAHSQRRYVAPLSPASLQRTSRMSNCAVRCMLSGCDRSVPLRRSRTRTSYTENCCSNLVELSGHEDHSRVEQAQELRDLGFSHLYTDFKETADTDEPLLSWAEDCRAAGLVLT